jgi:hypothetical protein
MTGLLVKRIYLILSLPYPTPWHKAVETRFTSLESFPLIFIVHTRRSHLRFLDIDIAVYQKRQNIVTDQA